MLVKAGQAKRSDLRLLSIEREANREIRLSALQSYHTHLMDLNLLCGIDDMSTVELRDADIRYTLPDRDRESIFTYQYQLDSLAEKASLYSFNLQYRPQLDLFIDGGLQVGDFAQWQRHFGWSAGLIFSWTIFDGKQRRWREQQSRIRQQTIRAYQENTVRQRRMKLEQCLSELEKYDDRLRCLDVRLREYESVLSDYAREMQAGQVSVLDYITVLRNRMQACRDRMLLRTNRKIIIATYNYWNH